MKLEYFSLESQNNYARLCWEVLQVDKEVAEYMLFVAPKKRWFGWRTDKRREDYYGELCTIDDSLVYVETPFTVARLCKLNKQVKAVTPCTQAPKVSREIQLYAELVEELANKKSSFPTARKLLLENIKKLNFVAYLKDVATLYSDPSYKPEVKIIKRKPV